MQLRQEAETVYQPACTRVTPGLFQGLWPPQRVLAHVRSTQRGLLNLDLNCMRLIFLHGSTPPAGMELGSDIRKGRTGLAASYVPSHEGYETPYGSSSRSLTSGVLPHTDVACVPIAAAVLM